MSTTHKKYELTDECKTLPTGEKVYRIRALREFYTIIGRKVEVGDLGGWVQSEDNLSHEDDCWLFDEAIGYQNSRRSGNSIGCNNSRQYGDSWQYGNSMQYGNSRQCGNSHQYGNSWQYGDSQHYAGTDSGNGLVCIGTFGYCLRYITIQPTGDIACGCFEGTLDEFKAAVVKKYGPDYGDYARAIRMIEALRGGSEG